jgi:exopolysaccharide biosynthesis polyprenyl glycosylphosphotransferase
MSKRRQISKYVIFDFFAALLSWILFFLYRKFIVETPQAGDTIYKYISDINFYLGVVIVPVFWICLYTANGYYRFIYRKRIHEDIIQTIKTTFIGVLVLFITLLLNDLVKNYRFYYINGSVLFSIHVLFTLIPRITITRLTIRKICRHKIAFNTVILGCGDEAAEIFNELRKKQPTDGNKFIGYIKNPSAKDLTLNDYLPELGSLEDLPEIINKYNINEVIIAISHEEQNDISEIINWLGFSEITVKALPGLHNVLKGRVKITNILGTPLIEISCELMPYWKMLVKQFFDIFLASLALVLLSPFFLICAVGIKLTSKGPVFLHQERIGKNGKSFVLFKFRSMYVDAEKNGPNLTRKDDDRTTSFGRFLRKTKLDEIPNFINVLKGDMSIVGPRPERKFFIDQIVKISPHYRQLQKIKPGVTSLGQVKFGYAENVEEMIKRLRFDILYLENISLYTDLAIIYYTIVLLFKGRHI